MQPTVGGSAATPFGAAALFVALLMAVLIFWPLGSAPDDVAAELLSRALYASMLWAGLRAIASAWHDGRGVWAPPAQRAAATAPKRGARVRR